MNYEDGHSIVLLGAGGFWAACCYDYLPLVCLGCRARAYVLYDLGANLDGSSGMSYEALIAKQAKRLAGKRERRIMQVQDHELRRARHTASVIETVGGTLLDCGANIGEVTKHSRTQFERHVLVEAHPETVRLLRKTFKGPAYTIIHAAVTGRSGDVWNVSTPRYSTSATVRAKRRLKDPPRGYYKSVTTISLAELVETYHPSAIKIDIEGCEYDALENVTFPKSVRELVVEFHGLTSPQTFKRMKIICGMLELEGFKRTLPRAIKSNWGFDLFRFVR